MSHIFADLTAIATTLGHIPKWLDKAEQHATARSFEPSVLLTSRLAPDQFPLAKQIQVASHWVKNGFARLADKPAPSLPDAAQRFADLRTRIEACLTFVATFAGDDFATAHQRLITSTRTPGQAALGSDYVRQTVLPNFYFHATTTYALLRHNGVELGKRDFIGTVTLQNL